MECLYIKAFCLCNYSHSISVSNVSGWLPLFYQVAEIGKKPRKEGWFKVKSQSSHFVMEYVTCFHSVPTGRDHVHMEIWKRHAYKVKVKDVIETANQDNIPQMLRYSVIEKIMGVTEI